MRLIATFQNENEIRRIANYLTNQNIANNCEASFDPTNDQMSYQLWIHDEDRIKEAISLVEEFEKNPKDTKFDAPEPEPVTVPEENTKDSSPYRYRNYLTNFLIAFCCFIFLLDTMQEISIKKENLLQKDSRFLTPIQALFMYDLPVVFQDLQSIIREYKLTSEKIKEISPELQRKIERVVQMPYWKGGYTWLLNQLKGKDPKSGEGPLFTRIKQGEVWRLITPSVLHKDFLHILFNMLWLWYLGRPIEQRIGPLRTLGFSAIAGVGSNTIQYLMSGPFFIGYSGIVTALAGFIWMRERIAPWEGYPVNRGTLLFILVFILAILALQVISFFIQIFSSYHFDPNIANTAHISGAVIGAFLARLKFFAQRVHP